MSPVTMFTAFAFLQVLTSGGFAAKLFLHQVCVINGEELACAFKGEGMYSVAANMAKDYEGVTRVVFAERFQNCVLDCSYLNLLTHLEYGISPFDTLDRCQHLSNNVRAVTVVSGRRTRMCPASPEVISTAAPATPRSSSAVPDTSSAAPATPRSSSAVPDISTAVPATSGLSGMIDDFKAALISVCSVVGALVSAVGVVIVLYLRAKKKLKTVRRTTLQHIPLFSIPSSSSPMFRSLQDLTPSPDPPIQAPRTRSQTRKSLLFRTDGSEV